MTSTFKFSWKFQITIEVNDSSWTKKIPLNLTVFTPCKEPSSDKKELQRQIWSAIRLFILVKKKKEAETETESWVRQLEQQFGFFFAPEERRWCSRRKQTGLHGVLHVEPVTALAHGWASERQQQLWPHSTVQKRKAKTLFLHLRLIFIYIYFFNHLKF